MHMQARPAKRMCTHGDKSSENGCAGFEKGWNMFTGIIEETGRIEGIRRGSRSAVLTIGCRKVLEGTKVGDSIAVNGVCLTVTSIGGAHFTADVMHETLRRSSLGAAGIKSPVNLERAMPADGRFGGHIVSGHIDGTGTVIRIEKDDNAVWYTIGAGPQLLRYIVEKGSIAIDGISLTVAAVNENCFQVSVIPHTQEETTLSGRKSGDRVNLECDVIGKYVEKLITPYEPQAEGLKADGEPESGPASGGLTEEFLRRHGF